MRRWSDHGLDTGISSARKLYVKLSEYAPDDKLSRDDIRNLLFILNAYESEIYSIKADRKKAQMRAQRKLLQN